MQTPPHLSTTENLEYILDIAVRKKKKSNKSDLKQAHMEDWLLFEKTIISCN